MNRTGLSPDSHLLSALISMYSQGGSLSESEAVFNDANAKDRCSSVTIWNAMIGAYGNYGHGRKALALLEEMQAKGVKPDSVTFINLLNACSHAGLIEEGLACFA